MAKASIAGKHPTFLKVAKSKSKTVMDRGNRMSGITYSKDDFPKIDYEFEVVAKRVDGKDFFATTTFPVGDAHLSFVTGGWGGTTIGLSNINGSDASENSTNNSKEFKLDQYYKFRVRVVKERIAAWIDDEQVVDLETRGLRFSIRIECDPSKPFGISAWNTVSAIKDIRVRKLSADEVKAASAKKD
jgi:hypothetical protein